MYAASGKMAPITNQYVSAIPARVSLPSPHARKENKLHTTVDLARREHSHRTDDPPDNARSTKHLRVRTDESILLCRVAHVGNIREHPSLHTKLDRPGDYGGDDLTLV